MKTYGKDKDYRKALYKNLIHALEIRRRIKTTLPKAKKIKREFIKKHEGSVKMFKLGERKGDGAEMVILEWRIEDENKTDKIKTDKKEMASN